MTTGIVFQVETQRILQILASEIYDSPLALLRENVQNAYDAIRMRFAAAGTVADAGRIDVNVGGGTVSITDNGVGMTEEVLRNHFWKAGSSGKRSEAALRAGVVGTFGIGAMANFGVCTELAVETRAEGGDTVLRSVARRDSLKIAEECITLESTSSTRDVGTTVTATLDDQHAITPEQTIKYLRPYVGLLPVAVHVNGTLISREALASRLPAGRHFTRLGAHMLEDGLFRAQFEVSADANGQVMVAITGIKQSGRPIEGELLLIQGGGQLMGFRSYFGLSPIPSGGSYQFGGVANLSFLVPTAGREAMSRESIDQVSRLVALAEQAASRVLAGKPESDKNHGFLQWVVSHGQYALANRVTIRAMPASEEVALENVPEYAQGNTVHYYTGTDRHILETFAGQGSQLLIVAQGQPRKGVQLQWLQNTLHISQVPDSVTVTRIYSSSELSLAEAAIVVRMASILRDDYLLGSVEITLADISHGVNIVATKGTEHLALTLARSSSLLRPLTESYNNAYDVFSHLMKDFVRVQIYPKIQDFVPSSTRGGVEALRSILLRNRELYKYEESERGDLEGVLGDFLSGEKTLEDVLRTPRSTGSGQAQSVSPNQVGTMEQVVPDVLTSPIVQQVEAGSELSPQPPIIRDDVTSTMKILATTQQYPQLNNFKLLLGLSDRLMKTEAEFFRSPHTTRIIWGGHRVIYIFTEATGRLSLYYDIELRGPISDTNASGGLFPTTTLITQNRIFVPVPEALAVEFRVDVGPKEFFVRFDTLANELT